MSFDDLKTRSRLQLSRLLHEIESGIDEILSDRTEQERKELQDQAIKLFGMGSHKFVKIMRESEGEVDLLLLSPHAVLHSDALELALSDNVALPLSNQADLYASLAKVMLDAIPFELRWGLTENDHFEALDPVELLDATVLSVSAMDTISKAKNHYEISAKAKKRAGNAHIENRAMKARAFEWCDQNMKDFKSLDSAAGAISKSEMPITFRTARSWVGDWKKLQSAGTP